MLAVLRELMPAFLTSLLVLIATSFLWDSGRNPGREIIQLFESKELADFGEAPLFSFTDQSGEVFSSSEIEGPWVFNIFFSRCEGPCPMTLANLQKLSDELGEEHPLQIISISVDPEFDTPEKLSNYAKINELDLPRWRFLSGPLKEINRVLEKGFGIGSMEDPRMHSTRMVLVDPRNRIRGYFMGTDLDEYSKLLEAVGKL